MLRLIFMLGSIAFLSSVQAQISTEPTSNSGIKDCSTLFVHRNGDNVEELRTAFKEIWTLNDIELISYKEFQELEALDNIAVFAIEGHNTSVTTSKGLNYNHSHLYLTLKVYRKSEEAKYCQIELFPSAKIMMKMPRHNVIEEVYEGGEIRNWNVGFLKNYLANINTLLKDNEKRGLYKGFRNDAALRKLKTKTLYIPDYIFTRFNPLGGGETTNNSAINISKSYPYKFKVLSTEELNQRILTSKDPFYYLVYVKSSTDKYVTIFNSQTGEMIYSSYKPSAYNFNGSDLRKLKKAMK